MKIGRLAFLAGGLLFAVALLLRPALLPDPGGGFELHASILDHLDKAAQDLTATITVLEAIDPRYDPVPQHLNDWSHTAIAGNAGGVVRFNAWHGGRVESAASLVIAPASRYSARV